MTSSIFTLVVAFASALPLAIGTIADKFSSTK